MTDESEKSSLVDNRFPSSRQGAQDPGTLPSEQLKGYSLIAVAAVSQSIRATCIHAILSLTPIPALLSLLTQSISFIGISSMQICVSQVDLRKITRKSAFLLSLRAILSGIMLYANLIALQNISVGTVLTILATAPSIATVLSIIFLGDKLDFMEGVYLLVNMIGVYFVASPSSALPQHMDGEIGKSISPRIGLISAFLCSFLMASNFTIVRAMGSNVHYTLNVFAVGLGALLCFLVKVDSEMIMDIGKYLLPFLGFQAIAIFNFVPQSLINYSMQFCRPGPALIIKSLNVPTSFLLGFIFLKETPTWVEIFGVILVLISVTCIGINKK